MHTSIDEKLEKARLHKEELRKLSDRKTFVKELDSNPCIKESEMVHKCLLKNDYQKEQCSDYFENFRNCKKFWNAVIKDRWFKGIVPSLPVVEEREKVKKEYLAKFNFVGR